ncbi:MAG TPA: polysaccharide biosynthesis/export family protein [Polyangiaceae bacterium]|nr:polysaccharide biosynthesis/export family protein [Polyangiaceae bacterium]
MPLQFRLSLILACLALVCSGCLGANRTSRHPYSQEQDPRGRPFVVGVADTLAVTVWRDQELSTEATVRPDGTITLPLIGEVRASGKTTEQLTREIRERVGRFVKDAIVTVAVTEVNSYRFTVAGNVGHPGVFTSRYYVTVSQALALAGGPNRYADDEIVIVRTDPSGKIRRIPIDYDDILEGDAPEQDIVILTGDNIYVP